MADVRDPNRDQPLPTAGRTSVQDALIAAIADRRDYGIRKYGRPLETFNGRDALKDAWEESLDMTAYLTQALMERDAKPDDPTPTPVNGLRDVLAVGMAEAVGSKAFREPGYAWDHARSVWYAHADAAITTLTEQTAIAWQEWCATGCGLRHCVIPGCLREFDLIACMTGTEDDIPEHRRSAGWLQQPRIVGLGYLCPTHAPILWANGSHIPRWDHGHATDQPRVSVLRCTCGWQTEHGRWTGYTTVQWQDHALDVLEAHALTVVGDLADALEAHPDVQEATK